MIPRFREVNPMASPVYFTTSRQQYGGNLFDKLKKLVAKLKLGEFIKSPDLVALKVHWGEEGNMAYVPPQVARFLVERIRKAGGNPFITDTNTLYTGSRRNAVDNVMTAMRNGFTPSVVGAPVIVSDGLYGHDYEEVEVNGKHFKSVKIASGIFRAKSMVVLSHVKGHLATGMGGAIKNISMGCAAPSGKQNMHSDVKPEVDAKECTGCGSCLKVCPAGAVTISNKKSRIDQNKCIGCAECVVVCQFGAIGVNWESDAAVLQEKMADYAKGALTGKQDKCAFINFVTGITPDCDCCNWNDIPFAPDIGIVASRDPVAADKASGDLINDAPWLDKEKHDLKHPDHEDKFMAMHGVEWRTQITACENLGIGSSDYKLIKVK